MQGFFFLHVGKKNLALEAGNTMTRGFVRVTYTCSLMLTLEASVEVAKPLAMDSVSSNVEIITTEGLPSIASMVAAGMEGIVATTVAEATATSKAAATDSTTVATSTGTTSTDTSTKGTAKLGMGKVFTVM